MPYYKLFHVDRPTEDRDHSISTEISSVDTDQEVDFHGMKLWTIQNLATRQRQIQEQLDTIKTITTRLQKELDTIRLNILPEKMDEEDITNITVTGVGKVVVQSDIYFSIPAETKEDAFDWLKDHGHKDLVQETVNASSGKAWAKEMLKKENDELAKRLVAEKVPMDQMEQRAIEIRNQLVEEGKALPEGLFKVTPFSRAQITKTKKD